MSYSVFVFTIFIIFKYLFPWILRNRERTFLVWPSCTEFSSKKIHFPQKLREFCETASGDAWVFYLSSLRFPISRMIRSRNLDVWVCNQLKSTRKPKLWKREQMYVRLVLLYVWFHILNKNNTWMIEYMEDRWSIQKYSDRKYITPFISEIVSQ